MGQHRPCRFGSVALPPMRRVQHERDLDLRRLLEPAEPAVSDDRSEALDDDGIEAITLLDVQLPHPRYYPSGSFGTPYAARNELHHLGLEVDVCHRRGVVVAPLTNEQALGLNDHRTHRVTARSRATEL